MATEKRLIDANVLLQKIANATGYVDAYTILGYINNAPTVDAVEVVHGQWIEKLDMVSSYLSGCEEMFAECSVCNSAEVMGSNYCPNCGAKMDLEVADG